MYKYRVEVFDKDKEFPFNLMMYETITAEIRKVQDYRIKD